MATKRKSAQVIAEDALDVGDATTPAGETIKAKGGSDASSKLAIMMQTLSWMSGQKYEDLSRWHNESIAQIGKEAEHIPDSEAARNKASVAMKEAVAEDVAQLFAGQDLSEEFKSNAATLFEAAVAARLSLEAARLEEESEAVLAEAVEQLEEEFAQRIDEYATYAAEEWMKENQVAVDASLESELSADFLEGLRKLFDEHYVQVPEGKVDVVERMAGRIEELEDRLNGLVEDNKELATLVAQYSRDEALEAVSEGLTVSQAEKLRTLAEGVDFDGDVEEFETKLKVVRDQFLTKKPASTAVALNEQSDEDPEARKEPADPIMKKYSEIISRNVKTF